MRDVTATFILSAPWIVLVTDAVVYFYLGREATISGVIRDWAALSAWPEILFLASVLYLYVHWFRIY